MGILRTQNRNYPYPDGAENVDLVTDLGELAKAIDTDVQGVSTVVSSSVALDDLTDVDTSTSPALSGQALLFDGTVWKPSDFSATGATSLDGLTDVDVSTVTPTNGVVLTYDSAGTQWVPKAVPPGVTALDGLSDVDLSTTAPSDAQVLTYDATAGQWLPKSAAATSMSIDALTDVNTTTVAPTGGQALVWDATAAHWEPGTVNSSTTLDGLTDVDVSSTTPTVGQVLKLHSDGYWRAQDDVGATAINGLSDVDTATTAPADGDSLVWSGAAAQWRPLAVSGSGTTIQDTGWRSVALASGWTYNYAYLRRYGNVVHFHVNHAANTTSTGDVAIYSVPAGFRFGAGKTQLTLDAHLRVGMFMNDAMTSIRGAGMYSNSVRLVQNDTAQTYDGALTWITDDAWPTTLPGTAV